MPGQILHIDIFTVYWKFVHLIKTTKQQQHLKCISPITPEGFLIFWQYKQYCQKNFSN